MDGLSSIWKAIDQFVAECEEHRIQSVVLIGSLARGELVCRREQSRMRCLGDVDLLVVDPRVSSESDLIGELERAAQRCAASADVTGHLWHFGVKYRTIGELQTELCDIERADVLRDGRVLAGTNVKTVLAESHANSRGFGPGIMYSRLGSNVHYMPSMWYVDNRGELITPRALCGEVSMLASKTVLLTTRVIRQYPQSLAAQPNSSLVSRASSVRAGARMTMTLSEAARAVHPMIAVLLENMPDRPKSVVDQINATAVLFHLMLLWQKQWSTRKMRCIDMSRLQRHMMLLRDGTTLPVARDEQYRIAPNQKRLEASRCHGMREFGLRPCVDIRSLLPKRVDEVRRLAEAVGYADLAHAIVKKKWLLLEVAEDLSG